MGYKVDGKKLKRAYIDGQEVNEIKLDGDRIWPEHLSTIDAGYYTFEGNEWSGFWPNLNNGTGSLSEDKKIFGLDITILGWMDVDAPKDLDGDDHEHIVQLRLEAFGDEADYTGGTTDLKQLFSHILVETQQGLKEYYTEDCDFSTSALAYPASNIEVSDGKVQINANWNENAQLFNGGSSYFWRLFR